MVRDSKLRSSQLLRILQKQTTMFCALYFLSVVFFVFPDIDECQNKPCDHKCYNQYGSYRCGCNSGFTLADDGRTCTGRYALALVGTHVHW